jgi:hypothetical protein
MALVADLADRLPSALRNTLRVTDAGSRLDYCAGRLRFNKAGWARRSRTARSSWDRAHSLTFCALDGRTRRRSYRDAADDSADQCSDGTAHSGACNCTRDCSRSGTLLRGCGKLWSGAEHHGGGYDEDA